ncbi:MAG: hypothetical protein ACREE7_12815, partial [Dongiaceae bacterium]
MHRTICTAIVACFAALFSTAQQPLVYNGPLPPLDPQVADRFVPDEIVVVFDQPTAIQAEALAQFGPLTGVDSLDQLARKFGVSELRKQFP